jgi:hypothetical protein
MEARLLSYFEPRLARLLRRAALQHIRRELRACGEALDEAAFLVSFSGRVDWAPAETFLREWAAAVADERAGRGSGNAPAAWVHLGQELASELERGGDWIGYLATRWRVGPGRMSWSRRAFYGTLAALAGGLALLILVSLARQAAGGAWDAVTSPVGTAELAAFVMLFGRVAGTVLMLEHSLLWGKRALTGKNGDTRVLFLGTPAGLALVEPR